MNRLTVITVLILSCFIVVGCGNSGDQVTEQVKAFNAHFDVVIEDGTKKYDPMELTVQGDHGTIEVTNNLDAEHGFVIREFGIKEAIPAGETMSFDVESAPPGEYMVDCHLHGAHKEATLTIEAP